MLQGVVEGELEPGVGEDGDQGGVQAFVEDQGAFGPVHGGHGIPQGFVHLHGTRTTRVSTARTRPRVGGSPSHYQETYFSCQEHKQRAGQTPPGLPPPQLPYFAG